jgi:hypothetical protein
LSKTLLELGLQLISQLKETTKVAKKKAIKKVAKKRTSKQAAPAEPIPQVVVFYELNGVAGVRFQGEFVDLERARIVARSLVASPDVAQAWIIRDLEIVRKPSG